MVSMMRKRACLSSSSSCSGSCSFSGLVFNLYFFGHFAFIMDDLVYGHAKESGDLVECLDRDVAFSFFYFAVVGGLQA